jgi:hypothetical protein
MNPVQDKCGFWIYEELPEGSVLVTMEMLTNGVMNRMNTPFVIYSDTYKEYQCYRVNSITLQRIIPFVELNRVYLLPTSNDIQQPQQGIIATNTELSLEL